MALPLFAVTLFVSAFLLFLVQPMIGKMILPRLGGTPQVWNTCMVFFQTALLAGYAYSHLVSSRLKLRQQLLLHGVLLLAPFLVLLPHGPFNISDWIPPPGANPIASTLLLLAVVVGLPFFVVSTSAPLLQRWFAYTGHPAAKDPYFLYAASNLGSMLALLAYPVLVEPYLHLRAFQEGPVGTTTVWLSQPWAWTLGYTLLVGLVLACCGLVWRSPVGEALPEMPAEEEPTSPAPPTPRPVESRPTSTAFRRGRPSQQRVAKRSPTQAAEQESESHAAELRRLHQVTWSRRLRWVALAAVPSSLMLGIITYMSTDVSAIPLFWVIPLALYLLSFIFVFSRWPVPWTGQPHTAMTLIHLPLILGLLYILVTREVSPIWRSMLFCLLGFFATAMVCHGELARDRPGTKHLTEYYLWMSVGGMLGGLFNGLIAPVLFWGLLELPVALVLSFLLRPFPSRLVPLDRGVALLLGGGAGLITGILLYQGVLPAVVCTLLGLVLSWMYQPRGWGDPLEGWTERWLIQLFPGLGEWAQKTGEQLARRPAEESASAPAHPLAAVRSRPNHYVLSYLLDFGLPLILFLLTWYLVANRSSRLEWLFEVFLRSLEMERQTAAQLARSLDLLLSLLPLLLCLFLYTRPLRFGLGLAGVLLLNGLYTEERAGVTTLWRGRSYFGIIRVLETNDMKLLPAEAAQLSASEGKNSKISAGFAPPYHYLMHGTTHHGLNYQYPPGLRRLATTYYHRRGPVGVIMERFNWFSTPILNGKRSAPQNTYRADARMPASIIAYGPDAWSQLINLYSEPPYACVGLGTGTMASYAHPYQHMTFYEIDDTIKSFHVPPYAGNEYFFNYVHDALNRQAQIEIIMGDARLSMAQEQDQHTGFVPQRQGYYHCIELDAFSSDAIPVHLITREAIQMYFQKLAPYGVLMVHTSNRHVDLVSPVVDIAASLGLKWRVGKDGGQRYSADGQLLYGEEGGYRVLQDPEYRGLFGSEYVMLARYDTVTINGREFHVLPPETPEAQEAYNQGGERGLAIYQYRHNTLNWYTPRPQGRRLWTDDYSNLLSVFRWGF